MRVSSRIAFDLSDLYLTGTRRPPDGDGLATWLLLYYSAPEQIRAELSLAHGIDRRGHVSQWIERIILPGLRTQSPVSEVAADRAG